MVHLSRATYPKSAREWLVCRSRSLLYLGHFQLMPKGACPRPVRAFHRGSVSVGGGGWSTPGSSNALAMMGGCISGPVWDAFQVLHLILLHVSDVLRCC